MQSAGTPAEQEPQVWSWRSPAAARDLLVVLLAATSGYVDAVNYLHLGQVFTSNMTGNTVLLGIALGQAQWLAALRSGVALVGYLCGVALGSLIVARSPRQALWPSQVTAVLALEGTFLVALAVGNALAGAAPVGWLLYMLIACSAVAMGMQSIAVRTLGVTGVTSTYITGTWTTLTAGVINRLRASRLTHRSAQQPAPSSRGTGLQAAVVSVYLLAAVLGGLLALSWGGAAFALSAAAVALVVVLALARFHSAPESQGNSGIV